MSLIPRSRLISDSVRSPRVAATAWPCYFTGRTAANEWALSDQVFRTTVLKTSARVRASAVRLLDHDYLIRRSTNST